MTRTSRLATADTLQARLHRAVSLVGGYWRPLAAVARLLEELGELAESLRSVPSVPEEIAAELADVWIITTCLATQFCVDVRDPEPRGVWDGRPVSFGELVTMAGGVARVVNYYDGPKTPRAIDDWTPLEKRIPELHRGLSGFAREHQLGLAVAVDRKVAGMADRESGRFATQYDPSSAHPVLQFEEVLTATACPYAESARIWGGPIWSTGSSIESNVADLAPHLLSFVKCAEFERLDGFVVALPPDHPNGIDQLARTLNRTLRELAARDPSRNTTFEQEIDVPGWQFQFGGTRLFVSTFSPAYDRRHPRHAARTSYFLFQPEATFDAHGIGGAHDGSSAKKKAVRDAFASAGYRYPANLIDSRLEAHLYILPATPADAPVGWWR